MASIAETVKKSSVGPDSEVTVGWSGGEFVGREGKKDGTRYERVVRIHF